MPTLEVIFKGAPTFPKPIISQVSKITYKELELVYDDVAVRKVSNYAMDTLPKMNMGKISS